MSNNAKGSSPNRPFPIRNHSWCLFALSLALVAALSLSSCGSPKTPPAASSTTTLAPATTVAPTTTTVTPPTTTVAPAKTEAQKAEAAKVAAARKLAAEKAATEKAALEKAAAEKAAADKLVAEKLAAEKAAADKVIAERLAAEKAAADKAAAEKLAADKAAAEKAAAEKLAVEKAAAEKAAADKLAAEKAAAEKAMAAQKAAADKAAADKAAADKAAADKLSAQKAAAEKAAAQKAAAEKAIADKAAADKAAADKIIAEKAAAEKAAADKLAAEKAAAQKVAADAAAKQAAEAAAKAEIQRIAALDVPVPVISTKGGVFVAPVQVSIEASSLKEALIAWTIDGSEPSADHGQRSLGPITVSSSAVVRARAFVIGGKTSEAATVEFTIGEVCAAPGASGDGRRGSPFGSVSAAAAKAAALGIKTVKLATGSFDESFELSSGNLRIRGGFKAGFQAEAAERTVIRGKAGTGTKKAPAAALVISGKAADSSLLLERIEFRGGDASYGAGIVVADKASPEIVDCAAYGGPGSYGYGAVVLGAAAPSFRLCRLDGGAGATSYGLSVDGATATVASSFLLAGTGTVSGVGIQATDARVLVASSVIAGRSANVSYGAAFYNSKGSRLEHCTVVGGNGKEVAGIFVSASDPAIDNCIISANGSVKSYGVNANYGESTPSEIIGTVFLGCSGGFYWDVGAKAAYLAFDSAGRFLGTDGKTRAKPKGEGNAKGGFSLGPAPGYETPASATLPAVKSLAGASAQDILGKPRGEPRRPGAY